VHTPQSSSDNLPCYPMDSYRCSVLSVGVEGALLKMHNTLQYIVQWCQLV